MRRVLPILLVAVLATLLFATLVGAAAASGASSVKAGKSLDAISWYQAKKHVGERMKVRGPVAATILEKRLASEPTFLNIGRNYPSKARFTVVIQKKYLKAFPYRPDRMYRGKTLLVTGTIRWYQGCANMFVRSPAAIRIIQ